MLKTIVRVTYDAYMINTLMYYKLLLVIFFMKKGIFYIPRLKQTYTIIVMYKKIARYKKIPVSIYIYIYNFILFLGGHKTVKFNCNYSLFGGRESHCLWWVGIVKYEGSLHVFLFSYSWSFIIVQNVDLYKILF